MTESHAVTGRITGSVIAGATPGTNSTIHDLLHSDSFLIYNSHDMYGGELGGALENVYAIVAHIAAALELGEYTIGMLLTRSLAEMSRFAVHMGANPVTFLGPAGRPYAAGERIVWNTAPTSPDGRGVR
jgi:glycerol-3-phosphate dehydrogenase (NAD(P)+)